MSDKVMAQMLSMVASTMEEEDIVDKLQESINDYKSAVTDEEKEEARQYLLMNSHLYTFKVYGMSPEKTQERVEELEQAKKIKEDYERKSQNN